MSEQYAEGDADVIEMGGREYTLGGVPFTAKQIKELGETLMSPGFVWFQAIVDALDQGSGVGVFLHGGVNVSDSDMRHAQGVAFACSTVVGTCAEWQQVNAAVLEDQEADAQEQ